MLAGDHAIVVVKARPAGHEPCRGRAQPFDLQPKLVGLPGVIVIAERDNCAVAGHDAGIARAAAPGVRVFISRRTRRPAGSSTSTGAGLLWSNTITHSSSPG